MLDFLTSMAEYRQVFMILLDIVIFVIVSLIAYSVYKKVMGAIEEAKKDENKITLKGLDFDSVEPEQRASVIRKIIAPDAVNPAPNSYLVINDQDKEIFIRSLTISKMPKRTSFAKTFADLLDFPSCTSSIFIYPISEQAISKKIDRQIDILESEELAAEGYTNRQRKLRGQAQEVEGWAVKVEAGEEKFFNVGFLFSIYGTSVEDLNKKSDEFRSLALNRGIDVTSCFAVQSEAYVSNMPMNRKVSINSPIIKSDTVKQFLMDRAALSSVFNYTEASFSHKDGIPLGRDLFTHKPFVFDIYDRSHDGYLVSINGKTGSGKSATIKMMCERYALFGYRFVAVDSQARKGTSEGEYASLAQILNGVSFQISSKGTNILNLFDVQESMTMDKDKGDVTSGVEHRTLELTDKITQVVNTIRTLMNGAATSANQMNIDASLSTYLNRIITDCATEVYTDRGIKNGDADSLYEKGQTVVDGQLTSGVVPKKLPTISDFYIKALEKNRDNREAALTQAYSLLLYGLQDYVRELYYSEQSIHVLTPEEYMNAPNADGQPGQKIWKGPTGKWEFVHEIHGIRPYYDGQSTLAISRDCRFTNIDISQLPESEKVIARQVAIDFVNEQFIKKNSENIGSSDKLLAIFDEAHENFVFEYARKTLENVARTARKRNASLVLSTQTVREYENYTETQNILKQAAVKMICKQDMADYDYLKKTLALTDSQTNLICNYLGGNKVDEEGGGSNRRGEMCVIDGPNVAFIKVDYMKATEALSVETTAEELEKLINVRKVA